MALEFVNGTLVFGNTAGQGAETNQISTFSGPVKNVITAVMRGYDLGFIGKDRPIHEIQAQITGASVIDTQNPGREVLVFGTLMLRDNSGNIDDLYGGSIDYCASAMELPGAQYRNTISRVTI